jgi:hypothetical protein
LAKIISYYNKNSISNSINNKKNHALITRIIVKRISFWYTNLRNHGISYIDFFHTRTKEGLYLLTPLQHQNFHIDQCVVEKMNRFKTLSNWITFVLQFQNFYHSYVSIQALNTIFFKQCYQNINHDPNLQISHFFAFW